jgi:hypothetical protein
MAIGSVSINDVNIVEGNSGTQLATFTALRSGGTDPFVVSYATSDNTATAADGDYIPTSGTLQFATGVNAQTFTVTINGDTKVEPNETFFVNLSGATPGATISKSQGTGTIVNDDASGSVAINDVNIVEGNSGTQLATFTVTRTGTNATAPFDVNYATADSTATAVDDDHVEQSDDIGRGHVSPCCLEHVLQGRSAESRLVSFVLGRRQLPECLAIVLLVQATPTAADLGSVEALGKQVISFAGLAGGNIWRRNSHSPRQC